MNIRGAAVVSRDWEEHRGASPKNALYPRVTITRYPRIHLNRGAYDLLGGPAEVLLLYDRSHPAIGIRAVADAGLHGYRLVQRTGTSYAVMDSQHFLRHYGFKGDEIIEFSEVTMEDDTMVLSLDQARRKGRGPFLDANRGGPAIDGSARAGWRPPLDGASDDEAM